MLTPELKKMLLSKLKKSVNPDGERIFLFGPVQMPIQIDGETFPFQWYTWLKHPDLPADSESLLNMLDRLPLAELQQSSVLTYGDYSDSELAKVRIHSICHTGDIFGSQRCDCGSQLHIAFQQIVEFGVGAIVYVANHEGRGIGLFNKSLTYALQEHGFDTAEANLSLGHNLDDRSYQDVAIVLNMLRSNPILLLSNNPLKRQSLGRHGVPVIGVENLHGVVSDFNRSYLQSKKHRFNHTLESLV
ncbi:GTP cyclohydrolase II [Cohnella silvisoli]|uniref:GTP cyclohydrolase II n=1 Tax=Cohnella silvisoli TaxID=2873699 RepID=UPI0035A0823F